MKVKNLSSGGIFLLFLPTFFIYVFSNWPTYEFHRADESQLLLSLKRRTEKVKTCSEAELAAFQDEQAAMSKHMRAKVADCGSRERAPLEIKIWLDGVERVSKVIPPAGWRSDGVVFVFEKFTFTSGSHDVKITMRDAKEGPQVKTYEFNEHIDFAPRKVTLVTYTPETDSLHIPK